MKPNESEPLMTCRKKSEDVKTGVEYCHRDKIGGYLITDRAFCKIHFSP